MNTDRIQSRKKDPLGKMLLDYLDGKEDVAIEVESPTLEIWTMTGSTMFREYDGMNEVERIALAMCSGKTLDVGGGSGCHSLWLQERDLSVDTLDISPGCIEVMKKRGVRNCLHTNLFALEDGGYDTVLMLMNGLGICGSIDGCNLFLQFVPTLLCEGGQLLADSTDFFLDFGEDTFSLANYPGETEFVMKYGNFQSDPFDWLYIDFNSLQTLATIHGLQCECVYVAEDGRYLARITQ